MRRQELGRRLPLLHRQLLPVVFEPVNARQHNPLGPARDHSPGEVERKVFAVPRRQKLSVNLPSNGKAHRWQNGGSISFALDKQAGQTTPGSDSPSGCQQHR
jgi:hypothetical protein